MWELWEWGEIIPITGRNIKGGVSEVINWRAEKVECLLVSFQRWAEGQREEGREGVGESWELEIFCFVKEREVKRDSFFCVVGNFDVVIWGALVWFWDREALINGLHLTILPPLSSRLCYLNVKIYTPYVASYVFICLSKKKNLVFHWA